MTVNALPVANAGIDQSINYGTSTTLSGSATSGSGTYTWHWEPATLVLNANIQNPTTLNLTSSAQFTLTVTDEISGCTGSDVVLVTVTGGPLAVVALASPGEICQGMSSQLSAIVSGGTGTYTYSWSSNPSGFTSSLQNPIVYPAVSTIYTVVVNDGTTTLSNIASVTVNPLAPVPDMPTGPDTVDMVYVVQSDYATTLLDDVSSWVWDLVPSSAGSIAWNDNLAVVTWDPQYLGNASIRVKTINSCGESPWSLEKITFVDNTVGIATAPDCKLLVYPNPVKGNNLTISFCHPLKLIEIVDMKGSVLYTARPVSDRFGLVHLFTPGVYFIKAVYDQGTVVEKILVY